MTDRRAHWESVYDTHAAGAVSWFQQSPDLSLKLIDRVGVAKEAPVLDVGGGAATLVDHLLDRGFRDLNVLDLSPSALDRAEARSQDRGVKVEWIVADIASWTPPRRYDLWHDRAVLHFLVEPANQTAYVRALRAALAPEGWAIIGGFAPGGPIRCSGLDVVQHDAVSLGRLLGEEFELMETHGETHATPWGADQVFRYHVFRRRACKEECE